MQDNKDKTSSECIKESEKLMNGKKWQLFCLDLSFIGWYILGVLCLGIGTLFVTPYHMQARTNFYEKNIKDQAFFDERKYNVNNESNFFDTENN